MSLVNVETGEIVQPLSEDAARRLTERIRIAAANYTEAKAKVLALVDEAKAGSAHVALGYKSWTAYLSDVLSDEPLRLARDERRELVTRLADEGMSNRAIAPIVGISHVTVQDDLNSGGRKPTTRTTTGLDGSTYVSARAGRVKPDASAMSEANVVNAVKALVHRYLKPENVAALSPRARTLIADALSDAIETLTEGAHSHDDHHD